VIAIKADDVMGGTLNFSNDAADLLIMMAPAPKELIDTAQNVVAFNTNKEPQVLTFVTIRESLMVHYMAD